MIRKGLIVAMLIAFSQGPALAQGWFDSVFGSGGLGLWNSGVGDQWNNPQFYGGSQAPGAQGGQLYGEQPLPQVTPGTAAQGYAPQAQAYPQAAPSYTQQGIYSDWHANQPAPIGPQAVEQYQPQEQYAPPQQQYQQPPPQYAAPQQQYQQPPQYAAPQQQYEQQQQFAPPPRQPARQQPRAQRRPARQPQATAPVPPPVSVQPQYATPQAQVQQGPALRQGQYAPDQQQMTADNLPAGAVQMTTTTPEGTQVQYFPPPGMAYEQPPTTQPAPRRQKPRAAAARHKAAKPQAREQAAPQGETEVAPSIPMPRPVEIPQGQDPRAGWGATINRSGGGTQSR
jgi:hypothetical protein